MKDIVMMPIKAVKPYENNPRINEDAVAKVAASLDEFGFKQPIVVDKNNVVIVGHTRLLAAKRLKMAEVPVLVADDLTDEQVKAYRLADNKTAEFAMWDYEKLDIELNDIYDIDMEQFGFELEMDEEEPIEEEKNVDEEPIEVEKRCTLGDIWQLGRHRLICGDSTDEEIINRLREGKFIDLVLTDPPYGVNVVTNGKVGADFGVAKKGKYAEIIGDDTTETAKKAYELCSKISIRQILFGGNYFLDFLPPSEGWIIWDKRGESGIRNSFADGEMAWCSFKTPVRIYHQLWNGMIREGEHEKRMHPTQKPIQMLSEIIEDFSMAEDKILDLFGGSGSVLIACEKTDRTCYMCELSEHYCDVIIQRWENLTGEKAIKL